MKRQKKGTLFLAQAGMIAALYVALTYLANSVGLASGSIQFRISEALCILACFTPAAIPGMTIGCFLANLLFGLGPLDVFLGTFATFAGVLLGYYWREISVWLVAVPTVLANMLLVPVSLIYYGIDAPILNVPPFAAHALFVGIGEVVVAFAGGMILYFAARKPLTRVLSLDR